MKKIIFILPILIFTFLLVNYGSVEAGSEAAFPKDWKNWVSVSTPLTGIGALPGCDADVSTLPLIYQETVATYCAVRQGGPGKVDVLVDPSAQEAYKKRNGKFKDGTMMILHLIDMKILMVSGKKSGEATYGVFTEDGKDITAPTGPLSVESCRTCHSGYSAFCIAGQCGKAK